MAEQIAPEPVALPTRGRPKADVLAAREAARSQDARWRDGRAFSMVSYADEEILDLLRQAYTRERHARMRLLLAERKALPARAR